MTPAVLAVINYTVSCRDGFTFIFAIDLSDRIHSPFPARLPMRSDLSNRLAAMFHANGEQ